MGYAQRAQQSTPNRVYADVQTFGACSSGPVVRTLDLATSLVTQVQRLDESTSNNRTLPVPTSVSDDELEWEADGVTLLQQFDRSTGQFANVPEVQISTPATSVQEEPPPGLPAVPGQPTLGQVSRASGVQPSTAARNDAWVVSSSSTERPVMSERSRAMFGAVMRSVIFAPMEPGMENPVYESMRQMDAARESLQRTRAPSEASVNEDLDLPPHPRQPEDANDWNATMDTATTETLQTSTTVPAIARGPTPPVSEAGSFVQVLPVELQTQISDQASDVATAPSLTPQPPATNTSGDGASDNASAISVNWQRPELL